VESLSSDQDAVGYCEKGQSPSPLQPGTRTQAHAICQEVDRFQQDVLYPLVLISAIYAKSYSYVGAKMEERENDYAERHLGFVNFNFNQIFGTAVLGL